MEKTDLTLVCADQGLKAAHPEAGSHGFSLHAPRMASGSLISAHGSLWCSPPLAFHPQAFSGQGLLCVLPSCRIRKLWFYFDGTSGTENYFPLKETDFGLKTAGGILSGTGCSIPNPQNGSFPEQGVPHTGELARCTHYPRSPPPPYLAPVSLPVVFLTP